MPNISCCDSTLQDVPTSMVFHNPQFTSDSGAVGGTDQGDYDNIVEKKDHPEKADVAYNLYVPTEFMPQGHPVDPPPAYSIHVGEDFDELPMKRDLENEMES